MYDRPDASDFLIDRPFGDDSENLLREWYAAAKLFLNPNFQYSNVQEFKVAVNGCFRTLTGHSTKFDQHLFAGARRLYATSLTRKPKAESTRPYLLLTADFTDTGHYDHSDFFNIVPEEIETDSLKDRKLRIVSPLYFLRRLLTSPEYLASEAYAHCIVRAEIFAAAARTFCLDSDKNIYKFINEQVNYEKISASLSKINSYKNIRDSIYLDNASDFIVGNMLSSMGYMYMLFSRAESHGKSRQERDLMPIEVFLNSAALDFTADYAYELRVHPSVDELPSAAQLLSELDGVALAMPGVRTVFSGGIRATKDSGAVVRVSGGSGTGKTTLALSTCAALAPLGTLTYYLSSEEEEVDLVDRIHSVTPPFILNTRYYTPPTVESLDSWFNAFHLASGEPDVNRQTVSQFIEGVIEKFGESQLDLKQVKPPGVVPFVVVLDGVHELVEMNGRSEVSANNSLHELVEELRRLNALVILLSADVDAPAFRALDYLVDVVISLDGESEFQGATDALRSFHLQKTRRQFANIGKHRYHISKDGGVRLYPNIASTLSRYKRKKWMEADKGSWYDFFAYDDDGTSRHWLEIFRNSHTLITGKGSSGKASFALRLLTSPFVNKLESKTGDLFFSPANQEVENRRRILILSFLYPSSYYDELIQEIGRTRRFSDRASSVPTPDILHTVLKFYPGHMPTEVLVSKISEELRRGVVQGIPYDSVLIDGLHNVFLQFPSLDKNTLIWPILSEIFRRAEVSVATTHAYFDVIGMNEDLHLAMDVRSTSNRSIPLLQSLVNSADFYLDVSAPEVGESGYSKLPPDYAEIRVGTALDQPNPRSPLLWNRSRMCTEPIPDN
jgi:KaiC/GvpD/RAD55 family RecA-like ATPase